MRRRLMKLGYAVVWATILACSMACSAGRATSPTETRVKVKTLKVVNESIAQEIESFGSIAFERKSDLSPLVEGVVSEFLLKEGSPIRDGQVLVKLRNPQLEMRALQAQSALSSAQAARDLAVAQLWEGQLQVDARLQSIERDELALVQKKNELDLAERNLGNKEELFHAGGTSEETIINLRMSTAAQRSAWQLEQKDLAIKRIGLRDEDLASKGLTVPHDPVAWKSAIKQLNTQTLASQLLVAQTRLDAAQTDLDSAKHSLEDLIIRAPMDGILGARYVERGEQVQTQTKLLTLIQTGAIFAVFPVPELQAGLLTEGMSVDLTLDAFADQHFAATVFLVSPLLDPASGTVTVKARMANLGGRVKPGMFVRAKVALGPARNLPVLSESAFVRKQGNEIHIFTIVNGRALAKDITGGRNLGGRFVIEKGLVCGELVVDSPSPLLKEGEAVDG